MVCCFAGLLFGAKVTLEGIETQAQLEIAKALGISYGQGFYWSRAVPFYKLCRDW
ncbi:MAG: EAL domain-containing protein, partial [Prochlorotrichaceae cyanobacterium]